MIISIDGPAASGKGTLAKSISEALGYQHVDTGLFYRAFPDYKNSLRSDNMSVKDFIQHFLKIDESLLRDENHGAKAAMFAADPKVRTFVTSAIRKHVKDQLRLSKGVVVDGRDIGTVVFPDAKIKLFVTASVQERARRRWLEMTGRGMDVALADIEHDIAARDARDMGRKDAPLVAAPDALVLDTTHFDREQAIAAAIEAVETARGARSGLRIRPFDDSLAHHFHDINAEWIAAMFTLEPTDREVLENPRDTIIAPGGDILFVEAPGLGIVGTCALQRTGPGAFELTKMGVRESARGLKAGEFLLEAMIARAQAMGASKLYLLTNHICEAAIHLYEKLGFVHDAGIMAEYGARYQRCDVAMLYKGRTS